MTWSKLHTGHPKTLGTTGVDDTKTKIPAPVGNTRRTPAARYAVIHFLGRVNSKSYITTPPRKRQLAVTLWQVPDAVDTVVCAPDDGWRCHPKHVEQFPEINKRCNVASCWIYIWIYLRYKDPWTLNPKNYSLYTEMQGTYAIKHQEYNPQEFWDKILFWAIKKLNFSTVIIIASCNNLRSGHYVPECY